ncbi:MAG: ester cyclase [Chloroflexota bacterium]|nr:ester cyclase [Chloroflexota bacterium]
MSTEENKAFVRRWFDNFESGNFEALQAMAADDHRFHFALSPEPLDGAGHLGTQRAVKEAIPDLHFTIEDQVAEGDKVVTRYTARGTHQGAFQGLPPTGKAIEFGGVNIIRIADGKNAEEWEIPDTLSMMQQLGAVQMPQQSG